MAAECSSSVSCSNFIGEYYFQKMYLLGREEPEYKPAGAERDSKKYWFVCRVVKSCSGDLSLAEVVAMAMGGGASKDYKGDVTPAEAWQVLSDNLQAVLVDVRTDAEWGYVGLPDLSSIGKEAVLLSWKLFPGNQENTRFVEELAKRVPDQDGALLFIGRSGVRALAAAVAMTRAGYMECFNVSEGFEGDLDAKRHRGTSGGWKTAALPWIQG